MMRIRHEMKLKYPVEQVYETFRDNPTALAAKIPQLEKVEVLSREDPSPEQTRVKIKFYGRTAIPDVIRPVLNPSMLRWVTEQDWDNVGRTNCYKVETAHFKEWVNVGGKWTFCSDGNGGTVLTVAGHVHIKSEGIPGIPKPIAKVAGELVEKFIFHNAGPNLKRMMVALERLLEQNYPLEAAPAT